jgi:hypothetical protein
VETSGTTPAVAQLAGIKAAETGDVTRQAASQSPRGTHHAALASSLYGKLLPTHFRFN